MKSPLRRWTKAAVALGALALAVSLTVVGSAGARSDQQRPNIVWLEQGAGNPYWDAQHRAGAEAARRLGFRFRAVSGNLNPSDQAAVFRQLINQDVDVIMLNAIDPKALRPALAAARQAGVKVLSLYNLEPRATASVSFDEIRSGRVAAREALRLLRQRHGAAEGKIGVLTGILGQPASDLRAKGFVDFMKRQRDIDVVAVQPTNWQADRASATMQNWLVKYPDLSLVYALSDTLAVPAMNVAQRQRRVCTQQSDWEDNDRCIVFVSVDGIFLNEVVKGRLYATELYSPEWSGWVFANLAYRLATNKRVTKDNVLKSLLVTPANGTCVTRMQTDMTRKLRTFPFQLGTLQQIASKRYKCRVLDAGQ
jgi:ABC-type sugar transport system substrate-binding protein